MRIAGKALIVLLLIFGAVIGLSRELRLVVRDQGTALSVAVTGHRDYGLYGAPTIVALPQEAPGWVAVVTPRRLSRQAQRTWQGLLVQGSRETTSYDITPESVRLLTRALELAPRNKRTLILCRLAVAHALLMRLDRPASYARWRRRSFKGLRADPTQAPKVIGYATAAWKAEPDNALYPWLIAAAYLVQQRDLQALAMLERAARLTGWDDHGRQLAATAAEQYQRSGCTRAMSKSWVEIAGYFSELPLVWRCAGTAADLGYQAERAGNHALAARWYRAVLGMQAPLLRSARTRVEALWAAAIPGWAELPRIVRLERLGDSAALQWHTRRLLLFTDMYQYLIAHGQPDLAKELVLTSARGETVQDLMRRDPRPPFLRMQTYYAAVWLGQWWLMLSTLICAATAIALFLLRPEAPLRALAELDRSDTAGAMVARVTLVVVTVALLVFGVAWLGWFVAGIVPRGFDMVSWLHTAAGLTTVVLVGLLFSVTAATEAWRSRRRREGPGFFARWLRGMRSLAPRAAAVFLALYLLMFVPVSIMGARLERQLDVAIRQGDLSPDARQSIASTFRR